MLAENADAGFPCRRTSASYEMYRLQSPGWAAGSDHSSSSAAPAVIVVAGADDAKSWQRNEVSVYVWLSCVMPPPRVCVG